MDNNINSEILDKLTKVCVCKSVTRARIKDAIINGADTLEKVRKITGAGSGGCKGTRCSSKIIELINEYKIST